MINAHLSAASVSPQDHTPVPYQPDSSSNPSSTTSSTPSSPAPPLPSSATPPSPLHPSPQSARQQKQFNLTGNGRRCRNEMFNHLHEQKRLYISNAGSILGPPITRKALLLFSSSFPSPPCSPAYLLFGPRSSRRYGRLYLCAVLIDGQVLQNSTTPPPPFPFSFDSFQLFQV